ncbi:MAG: ABC transporter permease [Thermoleophilaceae bacterium]|nr:ABC transporter permease [Thermoleophilaceae bacterium]
MSRARSPLFWSGATLVGTLALIAMLAPVLSPYDPRAVSGPSLVPPSGAHLLGTNDAGQDILSQLIWGARSSALVAVLAAGLAVAIGVFVGVGAGLARGWVDAVAMRVVDVFLAVPALPLLILVAALLGPSGPIAIAVIIGLAGWPAIARIVRSQALGVARRGYVDAARGFGAGRLYLVGRHLVPALGPLIAANFVYWAGTAVALQAGLAFLGLSDPTEVSWGSVLNRALSHPGVYFTSEWTWWVLPAGLAITLAVVGLAFLALALEPGSNPRLRRS